MPTAAGQRLVMAMFDRSSRSKSMAMPIVNADMPNFLLVRDWRQEHTQDSYLSHRIRSLPSQEAAIYGRTDHNNAANALSILAILVEMGKTSLHGAI